MRINSKHYNKQTFGACKRGISQVFNEMHKATLEICAERTNKFCKYIKQKKYTYEMATYKDLDSIRRGDLPCHGVIYKFHDVQRVLDTYSTKTIDLNQNKVKNAKKELHTFSIRELKDEMDKRRKILNKIRNLIKLRKETFRSQHPFASEYNEKILEDEIKIQKLCLKELNLYKNLLELKRAWIVKKTFPKLLNHPLYGDINEVKVKSLDVTYDIMAYRTDHRMHYLATAIKDKEALLEASKTNPDFYII